MYTYIILRNSRSCALWITRTGNSMVFSLFCGNLGLEEGRLTHFGNNKFMVSFKFSVKQVPVGGFVSKNWSLLF